jgi:hypothetical protein
MQSTQVTLALGYVTLSVPPHTPAGQAVGCLPPPGEGQANEEMVNRFYSEAWGAGDRTAADEVFAPGHILHNGAEPRRVGPRQSAIIRKAHRRVPA